MLHGRRVDFVADGLCLGEAGSGASWLGVVNEGTLARFVALYAALFAAFGVASPFLPGLLQQDGLGAGSLGVVLAGGTAVRLVSGPLGGRLADLTERAAAVLAGFAAAAALVALGYVPARGLAALLLVSVAHAAVLAPLTPIADALALGSARGGSGRTGPSEAESAEKEPAGAGSRRAGFEYGWVRAAGSAAFILGTLLSGQLVGVAGLGVVVWLNAGLLALAAALACLVPNRVAGRDAGGGAARTAVPGARAVERGPNGRADGDEAGGRGAMLRLLRLPVFGRLMLVVALVGGSRALHDSFEVIRWRSAGLTPAQCSVLWAVSVAAEMLVFLVLGRRLLGWLEPARAAALSTAAGVVRWGTAAQTAWFPALMAVEPLHGLTFALLHLACMEMIRRVVPVRLAATAQAFYGTVAMGAAAAAATLASGPLYGRFGAGAFWVMAAMCAAALPLAASLWAAPVGGSRAGLCPDPPKA